MKRLIILLSVILVLVFITSCPNILPGPCKPHYPVGLFNTTNILPFMFDVEFENATGSDIRLSLICYAVTVRYGFNDNPTSPWLTPSWVWGKSFLLENAEIKEELNQTLINKDFSSYFYRVINPDLTYENEDYKTVYPGVLVLSLGEDYYDENNTLRGTVLWTSFECDNNVFCLINNKDPRSVTVKDYEDNGGDFYYILDPEKSGTTSFGHVVSSDPDLNNKKMESGHVKIKLTIKDDPENEGKRLVEFAYLGEVTEGE